MTKSRLLTKYNKSSKNKRKSFKNSAKTYKKRKKNKSRKIKRSKRRTLYTGGDRSRRRRNCRRTISRGLNAMKNAICPPRVDQEPAEEAEPYLPTPENSASAAGDLAYALFRSNEQDWESLEKRRKKAESYLREKKRLYNKQVHDRICEERERLGIVISPASSEVGSDTEDDIETDTE